MSYQVLARKWRPRDFASLVGQDHVVRALTHALRQQRLHHAWLFTGTRGVGKTTLSRILAKALNCIGVDGAGGITAEPCNQCAVCTAIDAGRFVDYIEMDAASNRGVDEMTALLERAVYAPSNARFKVYMIDEVHMLTSHAFNAMLKTLEEPPEYVKFILATTDPQKIPVTVLSRCLQFNLKQMSPAAVTGHLGQILAAEGIEAEPAGLHLLAHAARGSMRDGLSLVDQAIAYGGGRVTLEAARGMLGAIDTTVLVQLLDALVARDGVAALRLADAMTERSLSLAQALRDLAGLLHRIALAQQVPDAVGEDGTDEGAAIRRLAGALASDEVQLLYQIALHGRNDLHLAPDEYAGFTMTLMRMLAFAPAAEPVAPRTAALQAPRPPRLSAPVPVPVAVRAAAAAPAGAARTVPTAPSAAAAKAQPKAAGPVGDGAKPISAAVPAGTASPGFDGDWPALAARLPVVALARELATRSELVSFEGSHLQLRVAARALAEASTVERLKAALERHFGQPVRVSVAVGAVQGGTAAQRAQDDADARRAQAADALAADPTVQQLISTFGATLDPQSIQAHGK